MIDIHTHILHEIDDGAKDLKESLALIKQEIDDHVDKIVLTPHFDPYNDSLNEFVKKREEKYNELKSYIKNNIEIILGSEVLFSEHLLYYNTLKPLCFEGTNYLLIEFPYYMKFDNKLLSDIKKLINKYEIKLIIAHIELYKNIKLNVVNKLKNHGCIIQVNADSIIESTDKILNKLFKNQLVDIIASDCHDTYKRKVNLREAVNLIQNKYKNYKGWEL